MSSSAYRADYSNKHRPMNVLKSTCLGFAMAIALVSSAQPDRWQQRAEYIMEIDLNVESNQFTGKQNLTYFNNSPETLDRVFYHLYLNAFQPGSMMDIRSRTISDPDKRIQDRIYSLGPDEIGYHQIKTLTQNGKPVDFSVKGTILEVELNAPIRPGKRAVFEMEFESQVPVQIRRNGRNNKEGIDFSMAQWYPKMCEFDYEGWHANPYIGREFHGVWGDFDVSITLDSSYTVAATGYLEPVRPAAGKKTWRFLAPDVHDFVWAADPDYRQITAEGPNGVQMHFFFQPTDSTTIANWEALPEKAIQCMEIMNRDFGVYPYKQFSTIQGGDGGMEYPMATLIVGEISFAGLVSVTVHEMLHNWYQGVLATNESLYPWMDEGFTSYAQNRILNEIWERGQDNPHADDLANYNRAMELELIEPLTTHSDHFETNRGYGLAAYTQGAIFCAQLEYILGEETFLKGMRNYFDEWKFKHPNPTDFKRVLEQTSGLELDWYFQYWTQQNDLLDYAVLSVVEENDSATIYLEKIGLMPMPLDLSIQYSNGTTEDHYIPIRMMWGSRPLKEGEIAHADWPWTFPSYSFIVPLNGANIERVVIDPRGFTADADRDNNEFPRPQYIPNKEYLYSE